MQEFLPEGRKHIIPLAGSRYTSDCSISSFRVISEELSGIQGGFMRFSRILRGGSTCFKMGWGVLKNPGIQEGIMGVSGKFQSSLKAFQGASQEFVVVSRAPRSGFLVF